MPALVLHVYDPFDRPADQVLTWEALARVQERQFFTVLHIRTMGQTGYAEALERHWTGQWDFVICEQDIVPSTGLIDELVRCSGDFCAFDYNLSHGVPWSHCEGATGFGLSKITYRARMAVTATPHVPQTGHRDMPGLLAERLPKVHIHRPLVEHHHGQA